MKRTPQAELLCIGLLCVCMYMHDLCMGCLKSAMLSEYSYIFVYTCIYIYIYIYMYVCYIRSTRTDTYVFTHTHTGLWLC